MCNVQERSVIDTPNTLLFSMFINLSQKENSRVMRDATSKHLWIPCVYVAVKMDDADGTPMIERGPQSRQSRRMITAQGN